jgi:hypothetical protein
MIVLPHAGVRNVFWNIEAPRRMGCYLCDAIGKFARTYAWAGTSSGTPRTLHDHLPQAFFIGIRRRGGGPVTIGGSSRDRRSAWMTVEGLGRPGIDVPSLYAAQAARRNRSAAPAVSHRSQARRHRQQIELPAHDYRDTSNHHPASEPTI